MVGAIPALFPVLNGIDFKSEPKSELGLRQAEMFANAFHVRYGKTDRPRRDSELREFGAELFFVRGPKLDGDAFAGREPVQGLVRLAKRNTVRCEQPRDIDRPSNITGSQDQPNAWGSGSLAGACLCFVPSCERLLE